MDQRREPMNKNRMMRPTAPGRSGPTAAQPSIHPGAPGGKSGGFASKAVSLLSREARRHVPASGLREETIRLLTVRRESAARHGRPHRRRRPERARKRRVGRQRLDERQAAEEPATDVAGLYRGGRSEPKGSREGTESLTAKCETESPAGEEQVMEEVCWKTGW